jgi:O-antigen ligase
MKRTIERIVVLLVYATFFVPLILAPNSFIFPFIVPKVLLFRSLVIAMLCGYALLLIINYEEYRPRFSAVSLALTAFLASFTLSTFFGMDAYHSFWDNHERMLGLFTVVHYVIYYFICTAVLKNWSDWKRALQVFLIAGSIVMFIGVLQKFNQNLLLNQGSDRVASTLGNAIYVGGYGLFLFFVSMLLASREKRFWLKLLYGGFSVLALFGLFFSGTRGSVLGILAGLSTVLIAYSFLLKSNPPLRRVAFYLIAFIVLLSGSLFIFRHNPIIANLPAVGRLLSTSLTNGSSDTRKIAWKIGIEGWQERPIFGWGPNNFFYAFNQFYNPRSLEFGYGETWFDNAHNIIINTLTVQGIFGLLTYLAIFVLAILTLWQSKDREQRLHLIAWGTGFLVAHLVQNITVFENPTSYLYFVFWLALVNRLGSPLFLAVTTAPGVSPAKDRSVGPLAIGSILLVGAALIFVFNIQPARANKKTLTTWLTSALFNAISSQLAPNWRPPTIIFTQCRTPQTQAEQEDLELYVSNLADEIPDRHEFLMTVAGSSLFRFTDGVPRWRSAAEAAAGAYLRNPNLSITNQSTYALDYTPTYSASDLNLLYSAGINSLNRFIASDISVWRGISSTGTRGFDWLLLIQESAIRSYRSLSRWIGSTFSDTKRAQAQADLVNALSNLPFGQLVEAKVTWSKDRLYADISLNLQREILTISISVAARAS